MFKEDKFKEFLNMWIDDIDENGLMSFQEMNSLVFAHGKKLKELMEDK